MRTKMMGAMLSLCFIGVPAMVGCDQKVAEDKKVTTDPNTGKTTTDQKTVEKTDNGGTKTVEKHETK